MFEIHLFAVWVDNQFLAFGILLLLEDAQVVLG